MKKLIFGIIALTVLVNSCRKPKGNEECTWKLKTTGMVCGTCKMPSSNDYKQYKCNNLDSLDTCSYNLFLLTTYFNGEYLSHEMCSTPKDSIVGKISNITLICNYDYNQNFKKDDTINSILKVVYQQYNGGITDTPIMLDNYLVSNPICTGYINFLLTQPPDSTSIQSFKIIYKEDDGTQYQAETKPIYIKQ